MILKKKLNIILKLHITMQHDLGFGFYKLYINDID